MSARRRRRLNRRPKPIPAGPRRSRFSNPTVIAQFDASQPGPNLKQPRQQSKRPADYVGQQPIRMWPVALAVSCFGVVEIAKRGGEIKTTAPSATKPKNTHPQTPPDRGSRRSGDLRGTDRCHRITFLPRPIFPRVPYALREPRKDRKQRVVSAAPALRPTPPPLQ